MITELHNYEYASVVTKNAVECSICGSPATRHGNSYYQCEGNPAHIGDMWVGIFTDLSKPKK